MLKTVFTDQADLCHKGPELKKLAQFCPKAVVAIKKGQNEWDKLVARVNTSYPLRYNHLVHNKIKNQRGLQNVAAQKIQVNKTKLFLPFKAGFINGTGAGESKPK
jgi:hypothetical protein